MIKSDRWIRSKCKPRTGTVKHVVCEAGLRGLNDFVKEVTTNLYGETPSERENEIRQIVGDENFEKNEYVYNTTHSITPFVPMIEPYEAKNVRYGPVETTDFGGWDGEGSKTKTEQKKILSYGTSSFGYDVTLSDEFRIFTNINSTIIDPLNFDDKCLQEFKGDVCIIPPNSYILGVTREYFDIPRNVMVVCVGKSTYARCGAIVNVTPIEPGFKGHVVIEISNATNLPMKIYANQGVAQFLFFESDEECETSYADKGGKYQGQTGMTLAKG